jgi:hypothetical protein
MAYHTTGIAVVAVIFFLIRYLNRTDTPKIKNLPEIPGVPLFGNLLQFGSSHAKVAGNLAKKYGAVFQVRLGNRVGYQFHEAYCLQTFNSVLSLPTPLIQSDTFGSPISLL